MVAMLIGCGLRRAELLALRLDSIQQREEHWVIADLIGKGGHVRTVPIPTWVKAAVDAWTAAAAITTGSVFRAINQGRARVGRRHVAEGAVGRRPRGGGSGRHRPDEHLLPVHAKSKDCCGIAFGLLPRSTQTNLHPRTHVIVVGPPGASTRNSKSGADAGA
jgi:hypothetical protein